MKTKTIFAATLVGAKAIATIITHEVCLAAFYGYHCVTNTNEGSKS